MKHWLFLDEAIIAADKVLLTSLTPGYLAGRGVFETMRSYQGKIFLTDRHLARLFQGLAYFHIRPTYSRKKLKKLLHLLLRVNKLKEARIRLMVWREKGRVRTAIICLPYRSFSAAKYKKGFSAIILEASRRETAKPSYIKSVAYLPFLRAYLKAGARGYDEAILLDHQGFLTEASRSNIFYVKDGRLYTPHVSCGILNGITRQMTMTLARKMGVNTIQLKAKPEDLLQADEAFLTNSLMELMPLTRIGGRRIGQGKTGSITSRLLKKYRRLVKNIG